MEHDLKLPVELEKIINSINPVSYDIVEYNSHKGRYCIKYYNGIDYYMLKWNDSEVVEHSQKLQHESEVYKYLRNSHITPDIINEYPVFVTKYIDEAQTIRAKALVLEADELCKLCLKVIEHWKKFIGCIDGFDAIRTEWSAKSQFKQNLYDVLVSGPIETKINRFIFWRNRIIAKMYLIVIQNGKNVDFGQADIVHGDFHLNNVLSDDNKKLYIIDLENVRYGSREVELAYLYAQIWAIVKSERHILDRLDKYINIVIEELDMKLETYLKMKKIYVRGISLNPRFKKEV